MSVYRPKYKDSKTGASKESAQWWYEFTFAGKRYREPAKTTRKTIAAEAEKQRRLQLEKALAGIPSDAASQRIASVKERVTDYLANLWHQSPREVPTVRDREACTRTAAPGVVSAVRSQRSENPVVHPGAPC